MKVDIYHPLRVLLITSINQFLDGQRNSEEIRAKENSLKENILKAPAFVEFTGSLSANTIPSPAMRRCQQSGRRHSPATQTGLQSYAHPGLVRPW